MSEINHSDFIHIPTMAEYFVSLGYEQRLALAAFYETFCDVPYGESPKHLDDRPGNFPFPVGHTRTLDNTIYAVNSTHGAHEAPEDYLLVAAQLRDGAMQVNELEILQIQHVRADRFEAIDKVINAKWHETSRRVSIRLGRQASVTSQGQDGSVIFTPSLPLK